MRRWRQAAVAFGSNLGDRRRHIEQALAALDRWPGVRELRRSFIRETAPEGGPSQGPFLNGVVLVETSLSPRELLDALLDIERAGGRIRRQPDGPRTIDLDLLFYEGDEVRETGLQVPHPRAHRRRFVLEPLVDVAPDWRHPSLGRTARELWRDLEPEVR